MVLKPTLDVFVDSIDDAVDASEMGCDGLFRLCQGGSMSLFPFDYSEEGIGDGGLNDAV